jgi:hypothetical protein
MHCPSTDLLHDKEQVVKHALPFTGFLHDKEQVVKHALPFNRSSA